jgi:hypothetical protein
LEKGELEAYARTVVVYYKGGDNFDNVQRVAIEREPRNIAMTRCYSEEQLYKIAGYRVGAYAQSTADFLMPNIAIYVQTPLDHGGKTVDVNVINIIGYAFDSRSQPDYKYFFREGRIPPEKWAELVNCMTEMWQFAFECAKRQALKYLYIADVGGGAFSTLLMTNPTGSYRTLQEQSLEPVARRYEEIESRQLGRIPDDAVRGELNEHLSESLVINAWDPWSMVGNGNAADRSLDGFFGRCTAMAVLSWPPLNPFLKYEAI